MNILTLVRSLLAVAVLTAGQTAAAAIIDFSDGAGHNLTAFDKLISDGSATASFANPLTEGIEVDDFFNLSNGLALGSGGLGYSWTVSFDATVTLVGIEIDFNSANLGFNVSGAGIAASDVLAGAGAGYYDISPLTFQAGESYLFTANNRCEESSCGGVTFLTWTFGEAGSVPAPASLALFGLGLFGLLYRVRGVGKPD